MDSRLIRARNFSGLLLLLLAIPAVSRGQSAAGPELGIGLVRRALAAELSAAQDSSHPMRYRLRKQSPRLTSTKEIVETRDGAVALLVSIGDKPPSELDEQNEKERLDALLADPGRQRRRRQSQEADTGRALKVLRALPRAFVYQYAGTTANGSEMVERFTFAPNPAFNPQDLETQALTALSGEIWIDAAHERVVRLEGRLGQDVDFGWGILGRLNKGGWIVIEQAEVGAGQWRIVRFKMVMSGRVLFKTRRFDTTEEESQFASVPARLSYQQAIQMLRARQESGASKGSKGR